MSEKRMNKALPMYYSTDEEHIKIKAIINKKQGWYYVELVDGRKIYTRLKNIMKGSKCYG